MWLIFYLTGSARVFGYTVYGGFLNRVYSIIRVFGISLSLNFRYKVYLGIILGIFGSILGIFGYFGDFFWDILVHHPGAKNLGLNFQVSNITLFHLGRELWGGLGNHQ